MTTTTELELLRIQAQAADQHGHHIYTNPRDSNSWKPNEAWVKAASPAAVLALLDRIDDQETQLSRARSEAKHWHTNHNRIANQLRVFTQRPDLPKELADRLPWYRELVRLQELEAQAAATLNPVQAGALEASIRELDAWTARGDGNGLSPSESESVMLVLHELKRLQAAPPAQSETLQSLRALHDSVELAIQRGALSDRALEIIVMQPATDVLSRATPQAAPAAVAVPGTALPYEPTSDMLIAARECDPALPIESIRAIYWAMWRTAHAALAAAPAQAVLAEAYEKELSKVSLRNYDLRMEKAALVAALQSQAQEHATQLAGQGQRTPGSFVNAAGILASDKPPTVIRKLNAAFHDAVTFAAAPAQAQEDAALPCWWPDFIQNVAELPDRNSPEDEPDAMIATADELGSCAIDAINFARAAQGGAA